MKARVLYWALDFPHSVTEGTLWEGGDKVSIWT